MARQVRLEYPGAFYHVMCRGDRRESIFWDDADRELWLATWAQGAERAGFVVHAWVLMTNHYHVLLETPQGNLVDGMKWFQSTYTARFNARHRSVGHLFQGRYKAVLLDPGEPGVILRVADYIHLNPARARMLDRKEPDLNEYPWSSHLTYAGKGKMRLAMECGRVWRALDLEPGTIASRRLYTERMQARVGEVLDPKNRKRLDEEWAGLRRGWFLGGAEFRTHLDRVLKKALLAARSASHHGPAREAAEESAALVIWERGLAGLGLRAEEVADMKLSDPRKEALAWLLKTRTTRRNEWIATRLGGGHPSFVTRAVRNFRAETTSEVRRIKVKMLEYLD
jgi:putative transposase